MFTMNLYKRTDNALDSRIKCDKKIKYSYNNYLAISAILELRQNFLSLLINGISKYKRDFNIW